MEDTIGGQDCHIFDKALRYQEPIEWVSMRRGQPLERVYMLDSDREEDYAIRLLFVAHQLLQRQMQMELSQVCFYLHFP